MVKEEIRLRFSSCCRFDCVRACSMYGCFLPRAASVISTLETTADSTNAVGYAPSSILLSNRNTQPLFSVGPPGTPDLSPVCSLLKCTWQEAGRNYLLTLDGWICSMRTSECVFQRCWEREAGWRGTVSPRCRWREAPRGARHGR